MVAIVCGLVVVAAVLTPSASAKPIAPDATGSGNGKIAFTSDRSGSKQIYVMDVDGSHQIQLTSGFNGADSPHWSPDGTKIAFAGTTGTSPLFATQIYVMNADGSGQKQLTRGKSTLKQQFRAAPDAWSPDGRMIASGRSVMNANGSGERPINASWGGSFESPDWSLEGGRIVFIGLPNVQGPDRKYGIFVTDAPFESFGGADPAGGVVTRLTPGGSDPKWSPDGKSIAFTGGRNIWIMNADGSHAHVWSSDYFQSNPEWSPNGGMIAFVSAGPSIGPGDGNPVNQNVDIYATTANGRDYPRRLTTDPGRDASPSWQPLNGRVDAPILEGPPPAILCGPGDRAWQAGNARIVCKPGTNMPIEKALVAID